MLARDGLGAWARWMWVPAFAGMTLDSRKDEGYVAAVREYSIASAINSSGISSNEA